MKTSEFHYDLPPELIAQEPPPERDSSRLMLLERAAGGVSHHVFRDLPALLEPGDLVVLNDTRVRAARLFGRREETGGRVEVLLLEKLREDAPPENDNRQPQIDSGRCRSLQRGVRRDICVHLCSSVVPAPERWLAFTRSGGKLRPGEYIRLAGGRARARLVERLGEEGDILEIESREPLEEIMRTAGYMPVPPYVKRDYDVSPQVDREPDPMTLLDRERYQTTYARVPGAVAAPTAGLHFTERVFSGLDARGIERAFVTLHVGPGTFRPVKTDTIDEHRMDPESYEIPARTAEAIRKTRARGGRIVAVGTTVTRTLEYAAEVSSGVRPGRGEADLFITPGYEFRVVDVLLTNFHLPRGTPLLLTSALAGRDKVLAAYAEAIRRRYRFFSYGDAMLIV